MSAPTIARDRNARPNDLDWIAIETGLPVDRSHIFVVEYGVVEVKRYCDPARLTRARGISHWMYQPGIPDGVVP